MRVCVYMHAYIHSFIRASGADARLKLPNRGRRLTDHWLTEKVNQSHSTGGRGQTVCEVAVETMVHTGLFKFDILIASGRCNHTNNACGPGPAVNLCINHAQNLRRTPCWQVHNHTGDRKPMGEIGRKQNKRQETEEIRNKIDQIKH